MNVVHRGGSELGGIEQRFPVWKEAQEDHAKGVVYVNRNKQRWKRQKKPEEKLFMLFT